MSNLHHQHHHRLCRSPIEREQRVRTEQQQQLQDPTGQEHQRRAVRRQQQQPVREQVRTQSLQKEQQQRRHNIVSSPPPRPQQSSALSAPPPPPPECRQRNRRPEIVHVPDDVALSAALALDGYQLGTTVGHGSYSKVRIAVQLSSSSSADDRSSVHRVACKVIDKRRQAGGTSQYVLKFLPRELDVLQSVRHPNVVRTHRIYVAPSSVLVFMDYCELGDLLGHLQHAKTMPQWQAHMFFKQICDAVDYLHRNDISHRDIKCENVLLESLRQVKLTDFGFARMCSDERGRRIMSQTYCGSSLYAAPEVLQGIPYDPKAYDVWALGVVLYVMLADCMPYPSANRQQIVANQMAKKFNKPKKAVSREAQKLFTIILEPDVSKRATVSQVKRHPWVSQPNQFHTLTR